LASEWYYAKDGQQNGPVSSRELKQLADQGTLLATDVVWKDGMPDWRPAGDVKGLIPERPPIPAPMSLDRSVTGARGRSGRRRHRSVVGPCVLMIAAMTLIVAMFVPWWSMRLRPGVDDESKAEGIWAKEFARMMEWRERELEAAIRSIEDAPLPSEEAKQNERRRAISFFKAARKSRKWWDAHLKQGDEKFSRRFRKLARQVDDDKQRSLTITQWGWSEGCGITSLVFGAVVLLFAIVFVAVPPLRNWSWIVSAVALVMGIVTLILSLIWIFKSPGQDVAGVLSQGIVVGPWLMLAGGVLFLVAGLFDTIFGILFVVRRK
jgi:GYF domain 2